MAVFQCKKLVRAQCVRDSVTIIIIIMSYTVLILHYDVTIGYSTRLEYETSAKTRNGDDPIS